MPASICRESLGLRRTRHYSKAAFVVAQRIGGQVFGAFLRAGSDAGKMVGFAMSLPAWATHHSGQNPLYLHSHMLAVLPEWRNAGIGRKLKLAQREEALARGITRMEWTFDPLEGKNAFLNIHRLGVIIRSYTPGFYGPSTSSLQAGLQTDRMHAEWLLDSDRVKRLSSGKTASCRKSFKAFCFPEKWQGGSCLPVIAGGR